ncbi:succinyldiaminopimelate transaminase [Pseudohalioglobus sediminis]|uniref:Succinyldiaminopimelate transaminase n=1 Tax=Pseudohalioglobus sediminis TaxID=2606449 RepID=A0A5B0WMS1_9GAMM|nr:succinyldiaminopimelate transaminase [Pseudohalioglobus sediminis]KAA1188360.1 succinyldiaminopimelate transaminase [Pseudohalioglobus sediminis]
MNPLLETLQPYPFEKLRQLFNGVTPAADKSPIALSIGEPQHAAPDFVVAALAENLHRLGNYPLTRGMPELRSAIATWLSRRFQLQGVDAEHQVLPVSGTREALFAFAQAVVTPGDDALVLSPNPFYQIYEGAALLAGARPEFINCTAGTGFLPDFEAVTAQQWQQCQLLYLCSPGNPTGAVLSIEQMQHLVRLAREYDFVIASDECYSEIYDDESAPPPGLLQACAAMGEHDYRNCVVFHSLSKRSNLPGMRSGFVAGDADILRQFLLYRTYHGCAMPPHHQVASIAAWSDEAHVVENRSRYREKFTAVLDVFAGHIDVSRPPAGFYLWPKTPLADTEFARRLHAEENVTVLPGSFLARESGGINPGASRVRMALVAELGQCVEAAQRIAHFTDKL